MRDGRWEGRTIHSLISLRQINCYLCSSLSPRKSRMTRYQKRQRGQSKRREMHDEILPNFKKCKNEEGTNSNIEKRRRPDIPPPPTIHLVAAISVLLKGPLYENIITRLGHPTCDAKLHHPLSLPQWGIPSRVGKQLPRILG